MNWIGSLFFQNKDWRCSNPTNLGGKPICGALNDSSLKSSIRTLSLLVMPLLCIACEPREPLSCRYAREIFSKPEIRGVVVEKYVTDNQRYQVLEIKKFEMDDYNFNVPKGLHLDFFEYVSINDTLRKAANSLTYYVIKPDGEERSFFLHRNCPDSLSLPR
jgi:hypothetical protein